MSMKMVVRLTAIPVEVMFMLMMRVMNVCMSVFERLMRVRMLMVFSQMQPDPRTHESGCQPERRRRRFAQQQDGDGRANEWRRGEI